MATLFIFDQTKLFMGFDVNRTNGGLLQTTSLVPLILLFVGTLYSSKVASYHAKMAESFANYLCLKVINKCYLVLKCISLKNSKVKSKSILLRHFEVNPVLTIYANFQINLYLCVYILFMHIFILQ